MGDESKEENCIKSFDWKARKEEDTKKTWTYVEG
jgi:hypothetical protein